MFRHPLFLSLLVFLALGAALIARVPLDKSPDESAHWQYIEYIAVNHALPIFDGKTMFPPNPGYEFHQPPLYYALAAPGWAVLPAGAQNYWARLVSLLCGAATLVFIWKSARLLFATDRTIAILATAFAALWPLHLAVSSGSNNDALAGLWAAALFWCGARVLMRGSNLRDAALMGVLIGLGALTKNTILVVGFAALAALFVAQPDDKLPSRAINLLVALATMTIIAGAWWTRNTILYGDPLALAAFSGAAGEVSPGLAEFAQAGILSPFHYLRDMFWQIFLTSWGFFGGSSSAATATGSFNPRGIWIRDLRLVPLMLAFLIAPLAALFGWRRIAKINEIAPDQKRVLWFYAIGFVLVALAWLQFALAHTAGGQARYLHAALLPMCVLLAAGWRGLWPQRALKLASWALAALLLTMTLLNLLVWKTLV